ncbi:Uncharacterized protein SCF082_LOCUS50627 [Durusdinium trenchii]|uniref:Hexosyltransferase n=1 Tax=Durusdinium trenchii TaxID=1381693 RepID=A0ABP0S960_9DINO
MSALEDEMSGVQEDGTPGSSAREEMGCQPFLDESLLAGRTLEDWEAQLDTYPEAHKVLLSYLLTQTKSAMCERTFSRVLELQKHVSDNVSGHFMEQHLSDVWSATLGLQSGKETGRAIAHATCRADEVPHVFGRAGASWAPSAQLDSDWERRYAGETERWVAALAQLGHDVPPDFLLSFQELCNLLGRSHASPTRSPLSRDICGESTVPAVEPTGCSCRTWGVHDAPLDFLMNFDLSLTPGETDRVLLLPPAHLALYPLTTRTRRRLQGAKVKVIEVPWIEPPGVSPTVAQRNQENHFGNREYIRLHAMNLDYDVVVYLDTDVRIVGDLNPIFEEGQDLFVSTGSTVAPLDGGFFAVRPSGALFRAMLDVLRTVHYDRETGAVTGISMLKEGMGGMGTWCISICGAVERVAGYGPFTHGTWTKWTA